MAMPRIPDEVRAEIKRRAGTKPARLIAMELGLTVGQVEGIGRRDGFSFKVHGQGDRIPAEMYRDKLQAAADEGLSLRLAAERLDISRSSAAGYAKRLGISFSKDPPEVRVAKMNARNPRLRANRTPAELAELERRRRETKRLYNEKRARKRKAERQAKGFAPRFSPRAEGVYLTASKAGQSLPLPKVATDGQIYDRARAPGKQLVELNMRDCRFPIGEPKDPGFFFCAADTGGQRGYCSHHHLRAYRAPL